MDRRTTGIVATVAATLLCGLPGICLCLFGALAATGTYNYNFGTQTGTDTLPTGYAIASICVALILILIPVAVGFFTLRRKPEAAVTTYDEPIPPPT
jgi:hypothetical protein